MTEEVTVLGHDRILSMLYSKIIIIIIIIIIITILWLIFLSINGINLN
jgi:hypothetical protein